MVQMNYFSACFVFELLLERNQGQLQTSVEKHTKFLLRHILLGESFRTPTKLYKQCPDTRSINSKPAQTNTYNTVLSPLKKKKMRVPFGLLGGLCCLGNGLCCLWQRLLPREFVSTLSRDTSYQKQLVEENWVDFNIQNLYIFHRLIRNTPQIQNLSCL